MLTVIERVLYYVYIHKYKYDMEDKRKKMLY